MEEAKTGVKRMTMVVESNHDIVAKSIKSHLFSFRLSVRVDKTWRNDDTDNFHYEEPGESDN